MKKILVVDDNEMLCDSQFPIIVMTAYEPVESEHVTLWLPKEFLFPRLLEKVRACLARAETTVEAK